MLELFQPTHLLFVLLVALVVFGPKRLMEVSRNLGRTIRSLQEYREELKDELTSRAEAQTDKKHSPEKKG